ncbi:MAG: hypothetical protein ACOYOB_19750, partial [Myxococcota bacterium]
PKAKALLPKFKPAHDALKAAQLAYNDADDAAIDASALVEECDYCQAPHDRDHPAPQLGATGAA